MKRAKERIKRIIDSIRDTESFQKALSHSSYQHENKLSPLNSYESLEFLGDSILNFHTSLFIYSKFSEFSEGEMSKLKQLMIKESTLAEISKKISLQLFLKLGEGEKKNGGYNKVSILADIFESFIGALYMERGELITWDFLNLTLFPWSEGKEATVWDYKTKLQEYCQSQKKVVCYDVSLTSEKNNQKEFTAWVRDSTGQINHKGIGKSKKNAEQNAAYNAMKILKLL